MKSVQEHKGDFGANVKPSKPECFGQYTSYAMLPGKKVCKFKRKR